MKTKEHPFLTAPQVYLAASAINNLIAGLPSGTDYFIGIVLVVMFTGHLSNAKGSLARAVYPFVCHLKWGWHAAERALQRGSFCLDAMLERSYQWSLINTQAEPVRLGIFHRVVEALDTSTIARFRAEKRLEAAGKGYWGRAGKAVRGHIVAAINTVVIINGIHCGLLRRTRFGASPEAALAALWQELPPCLEKRLIVVDAGIATKEQFSLASEEVGLLGRLRINTKLRSGAPPSPSKQRGRPKKHGAIIHPGRLHPEIEAATEVYLESDKDAQGQTRQLRLRRWNALHDEAHAEMIIDVVRVDDPKFARPWLLASTARELNTEEFFQAYKMRATIETNFAIGQACCASEQARAFTEEAVKRRISLSLMCGSLLKAIAANGQAMALGPWDRKPQGTAGRLANVLSQQAMNFAQVALAKVSPRNYRKNQKAKISEDLELKQAA